MKVMKLKKKNTDAAGVDMALIKCNLSHELIGSVPTLLWRRD